MCSQRGCDGESADICQTRKCVDAGRLEAEDFAPMSLPELSITQGALFIGDVGDRFGGRLHFDQSCTAILSFQLAGIKHWDLWSPSSWRPAWRSGEPLAPHTYFATVLREGDAILFPPGWYHATRVLVAPSVSTSYSIHPLPMYASSAFEPGFYRGSPLGYARCATHEGGWEAFNRDCGEAALREAVAWSPPPEFVVVEEEPEERRLLRSPEVESPAARWPREEWEELEACAVYCAEPCSELNGDVVRECGGCSGSAFKCRPGAAGFSSKRGKDEL